MGVCEQIKRVHKRSSFADVFSSRGAQISKSLVWRLRQKTKTVVGSNPAKY